MKLLIISFEHPPQPGGIGTYSYQISKNLNKLGVEISMLATTGKASKKDVINFDKKVSYKISRYNNYTFKIIDIYHRFKKTILAAKKFKSDFILVAYPTAIYIAYLIKIILGIPYIIMGHGSEFNNKRKYKKKLYNFALKKADFYIANSNFTASLMNKNFSIQKNDINVIPLGADVKKFKPIYNKKAKQLKNRLNLDNKKILLTVGRISERKGQDFVIKTLSKIKDDYPDLVYLIVGKGPKINEFKRLAKKLNVQDKVIFSGFVKDKDLPLYYQMSDIFILPSRNTNDGNVEGFGIVISEANLMKLPVLATTGSGIVDAVVDGETGYLIPQDDVVMLSKKIKMLIENRNLRITIGEQAREVALTKYNWTNVAKKTMKLLNDKVF